MKKTKLIISLLCMIICLSLGQYIKCEASGNVPAGYQSYTTKASFGDYAHDRYFMFHARNTASSFVTLSDGTYMRVHDRVFDKKLTVEYYDKSFQLTGTRDVKYELDQFNGFHTDGTYHYLIFSQRNQQKDSNKVVCTVVKYSSQWELLQKCDIKGKNIVQFMWCSNTAMLTDNGKLYIKSAREKYDGHQRTVNYVIRTSDMKLLVDDSVTGDNKYGSASHSMAQYLAKDGHTIISAEHGDGSPRGVEIHDSGKKKSKVVLKCAGEWGQNYTGLQLGGLAVSEQAYITVGSTMDQSVKNVSDKDFPEYCRNAVSNVFISVWDRNTDKARTIYLTDYKDNDEFHIPYIVEINRNRFMVMWSHSGRVYYVEIDGTGNLTSSIQSVEALMHVKPIVNGRDIVWISYDHNGNITFYSLPIDSVKVNLKTPGGMTFKMQSDGISLKWNCVSGADGYYLYRKTGKSSYKKIAQIKDGSKTVYKDKKVKDGTDYTYTVRAYRYQGNTVTSNVKKAGWKYWFLKPVKIKSVTNKKDSIIITWENKRSESGYYLYREYHGKVKKIATLGANKTSYEDKKVEGYHKYNYYVVQYKGKKLRSVDNPKKAIYRLEPPDKMTAKVKDGYIELPVYPMSDEDTCLYRSVDGGAYKKIATVKTRYYKDKNVSNGKVYRYRTAIKYKGSHSTRSDVTEIKYLDKVTLSKVYNSKNSVKITWTQNKKASKYYVYRKSGINTFYEKIATVSGSSNTSYIDKNVIHTQKYSYMVKAAASGGISAGSNTETIVHLNEPVMDSIKVCNGYIKVDFSVANTSDIDLYRKTKNTDYVKVKHFTGDYAYTYKDIDVKSGETYTYAAKAVDGNYKSSMDSKGISATYISSIKTLNATQKGDKVTLSWDKVSGATGYRIYNMHSKLLGTTSENRYEVTLKENVEYQFSVSAVCNNSITKQIDNQKVFYYLAAPKIVSVTQQGNTAYITVNASPYYRDVSLYISTKDGYTKVSSIMDWSNTFETHIPEDGAQYNYKIVATDKFENKKEAVCDTKVSYIGTTSMESVQYDNINNVVKIKWKKADAITSGYLLYKSVDGKAYTQLAKIDSADITSFEDTEVSENHTYCYKISSYGVVEGEKSSELQIYIPKSPDGLNVLREGQSFLVSWNPIDTPVDVCTNYILHVKYPDGRMKDISVETNATEVGALHGTTEFYVTSCVDGVESKASGEIVKAGYVKDDSDEIRRYVSLEHIEGGYKVSFPELQDVDGYALYRHDGENEELVNYLSNEDIVYTIIDDIKVIYYNDTELTSGKHYVYRVCGYIEIDDVKYIGDGITSNSILFVGRPKILDLTSANNKVSMTWESVAGATEYTVYRREAGKIWAQIKAGIVGNSYIDENVTVGNEYEYAIQSIAENDGKTENVSYFNEYKTTGDKIIVK